ncbi:PxKF domain-containing protein [Variovorax guangxiensis]|uniref:PxKF domain-containing protein n=1 Tax=Variovorax guangxiensis TaxID=1775474 RepID=UPI0038F64CB6
MWGERPGGEPSDYLNVRFFSGRRGRSSTQHLGHHRPALRRASGGYVYTWPTDRGWARSCRRLMLELADGTRQHFLMQFR